MSATKYGKEWLGLFLDKYCWQNYTFLKGIDFRAILLKCDIFDKICSVKSPTSKPLFLKKDIHIACKCD